MPGSLDARRRFTLLNPAIFARYRAGDSLAALGAVATRADATTCATFQGNDGLVHIVAANVLRDLHFRNGQQTTLREGARTNRVQQPRDLTAAGWLAVTATVAKDQTGADGTANAASSILATAGNATVLYATVLGSNKVVGTARVKRLVGAGTINMTQDGGLTWAPIAVTASYQRFALTAATLVNPSVGFQVVTNGDKIAVDFIGLEVGAFASTDVVSAGAATTRAADVWSLPLRARGLLPQPMTMYNRFVFEGADATLNEYMWSITGAGLVAPYFACRNDSSATLTARTLHHNGTAAVLSDRTAAPVVGDLVEVASYLSPTGFVQTAVALNEGIPTFGAASAANALAAAWNSANLRLTGVSSQEPYMPLAAILGVFGADFFPIPLLRRWALT